LDQHVDISYVNAEPRATTDDPISVPPERFASLANQLDGRNYFGRARGLDGVTTPWRGRPAGAHRL
jgi:hypothetical protein